MKSHTVYHTFRTDERRAFVLLQAHPAVRTAALFGETIHVRVDDAARDWPRARAALTDGGLAVLEEHAMTASLEDVFIELVGARG